MIKIRKVEWGIGMYNNNVCYQNGDFQCSLFCPYYQVRGLEDIIRYWIAVLCDQLSEGDCGASQV